MRSNHFDSFPPSDWQNEVLTGPSSSSRECPKLLQPQVQSVSPATLPLDIPQPGTSKLQDQEWPKQANPEYPTVVPLTLARLLQRLHKESWALV